MEEAIKFGKWLTIHTEESKYTLGPCRRYKNVLYTINELYVIYDRLKNEK